MYVLGISCATGHDPSACLMKDGQLLTMCEEERFCTVPHAIRKIPIQSIQYCLAYNHITLEDVDVIAFSWDYSINSDKESKVFYYQDLDWLVSKKYIDFDGLAPKIEYIDHHLAHAASSYFFSGFDTSAVLVVDGSGECHSTSWYFGNEQGLTLINTMPDLKSLGHFYSEMTKALGFGFLNDGKTMGLAPYGTPRYHFDNIITNPDIGYDINIPETLKFYELPMYWQTILKKMHFNSPYLDTNPYPIPKHVLEKLADTQNMWGADLAASVQQTLEECYINLAKRVVKETGAKHLCLAGGVALNCVANGKLIQTKIVEDIFIQPAAGDSGTSLGAAAQVMAMHGYKIKPLDHVYYGPSFPKDRISAFIEKHKLKAYKSENLYDEVASFLEKGNIVAIFRDKAEFGPRALGNRSILANPAIPNIKDIVNQKVKFRENFRPFGASIMKEYAAVWFEAVDDSPYMLKTYKVKFELKQKISGIVHVDGTSRLQTVTEQTNTFLYHVLQSFHNRTRIPILLNTSFNLKGKAIVHSLEDARDTFINSNIDVLVLQDYVITK